MEKQDIYISKAGDTVDQIAWDYYGYLSGTMEAIYEANPGLVDKGAVLPANVRIVMPNIPGIADNINLVQLWD